MGYRIGHQPEEQTGEIEDGTKAEGSQKASTAKAAGVGERRLAENAGDSAASTSTKTSEAAKAEVVPTQKS